MPWIALEPTTLHEREELLKRWDHDWAEGTGTPTGCSGGPCRRRSRPHATDSQQRARDRLLGASGLHRSWVCDPCGASAHDARTEPSRSDPYRDSSRQGERGERSCSFKLGFEMVGEQAVKAAAPGETGLSCVWRVDHASWAVKATGSGRGRAITTGRPESARLSRHD